MDNNNYDNSVELYFRHQSTREGSISNDTPCDEARKFHSTEIDSKIKKQKSDDFFNYNPSSISIISSDRSIIVKPKTKLSQTATIFNDKKDVCYKTNRLKGRSALTSSFLRKKRIEYAGLYQLNHFWLHVQ